MKEEWKGFRPVPQAPSKKATLESLSFCVYEGILSQTKLQQFIQHIDFTTLRQLSFDVNDAEVLAELTVNGRISRLETLSLSLQRQNTDTRFEAIGETFLRHLNPLTVLHLSGTIHEELMLAICQQHGGTLKELSITPYEDYYDMAGPPFQIDAYQIQRVGNYCRQLSDLSIRIKRTKGDASETKCYEALGTIRSLKSASIHLDCSNPPETRSDDAQLEVALVNSAIDPTLVMAIWDTICDGSDTYALERLTITSGGGSSFGNTQPGDLMTIVNHMSRTYQTSKTTAGIVHEVVVEELTREDREKRDIRQRENEKFLLKKWGHRGLTGPSFETFKRLWPFEENEVDWREVWRSMPLQRSK
jgi:hypothetical protein